MCVDEFHQGGESHWKSFRPEMMRRSTSLRLYGVKNCPTICMTATATPKEIEGVEKAMGLREEAVKLTSSPVLDHMKFSIIRRPSNINGWEGIEKKDGTRSPGLFDLVDRIFLNHYVNDLENNIDPKKAIIFCRGGGMLGSLYSHVMKLTKVNFKISHSQGGSFN